MVACSKPLHLATTPCWEPPNWQEEDHEKDSISQRELRSFESREWEEDFGGNVGKMKRGEKAFRAAMCTRQGRMKLGEREFLGGRGGGRGIWDKLNGGV